MGSAKAQEIECRASYYNHLADSCLKKAHEWENKNNPAEVIRLCILAKKYVDTSNEEANKCLRQLKQIVQLKMDLQLISMRSVDSALFKRIDSLLKQN